MMEFFVGWRRKIGMVTLMMACLSTAGWLRSFSKTDRLKIHVGEYNYHWFASFGGEIAWQSVIPFESPRWSTNSTPYDSKIFDQFAEGIAEQSLDDLLENQGNLLNDGCNNRRTFCGFGLNIGERFMSGSMGSSHVTIWKLSYQTFTIPVAAASLLILLTKPRKTTTMKFTEPTSVEEKSVTGEFFNELQKDGHE